MSYFFLRKKHTKTIVKLISRATLHNLNVPQKKLIRALFDARKRSVHNLKLNPWMSRRSAEKFNPSHVSHSLFAAKPSLR